MVARSGAAYWAVKAPSTDSMLPGPPAVLCHPDRVAALLSWLRELGHVVLVGVEGTGAYGAGLAFYLRAAAFGYAVFDRPLVHALRDHAVRIWLSRAMSSTLPPDRLQEGCGCRRSASWRRHGARGGR